PPHISVRYLGRRDHRREFGVARDVDKQIIRHPTAGRIVGIGRWNSYREQIVLGGAQGSRKRSLVPAIAVEALAIETDVLGQSLVNRDRSAGPLRRVLVIGEAVGIYLVSRAVG